MKYMIEEHWLKRNWKLILIFTRMKRPTFASIKNTVFFNKLILAWAVMFRIGMLVRRLMDRSNPHRWYDQAEQLLVLRWSKQLKFWRNILIDDVLFFWRCVLFLVSSNLYQTKEFFNRSNVPFTTKKSSSLQKLATWINNKKHFEHSSRKTYQWYFSTR